MGRLKKTVRRANFVSKWYVIHNKEASFVYKVKRGFLLSDALDCGLINLKSRELSATGYLKYPTGGK